MHVKLIARGEATQIPAVNVNLVAFDVYLGDTSSAGQVMALFIIALAAAEVGIGIAIVLMIFRNRRSADVDELDTMRN